MKSSFDQSYDDTMVKEGGWCIDTGGETYKGVARKFHSEWPGFVIIDKAKEGMQFANTPAKVDQLNRILGDNQELQNLVRSFYRVNFWNPIYADQLLQEIAEELFDTFVNMGGVAVSFLQKILNALNYNPETGLPFDADLTVDGSAGPKTIKLFNTLVAKRVLKTKPIIEDIYNRLNAYQLVYYTDISNNKLIYRPYTDGWNLRVDFDLNGVPTYKI